MDEFNDFKMGWMIVAFDLPVGSKKQRKEATKFRKFLLDDGYMMIQYSVYVRSLVTYSRMDSHLRRLKDEVPKEGTVRAIFVTQAQWEKSFIIHGNPAKKKQAEGMPEQLQLW